MTVVEHDQISISLEPLRKKNCSLEDRMHVSAGRGGDFDTVVCRKRIEFRVALTPEAFDHFAIDRPRQRALYGPNVNGDAALV